MTDDLFRELDATCNKEEGHGASKTLRRRRSLEGKIPSRKRGKGGLWRKKGGRRFGTDKDSLDQDEELSML